MIKKFSFLLFASALLVAVSVSQAGAALNISINKLSSTSATIQFTTSSGNGLGTLVKPLGTSSFLSFDGAHGAGNTAVLSGNVNGATISPSALLLGLNGNVPSAFSGLSISGSAFILDTSVALNSGGYFVSNGVFNLSGANLNTIANGTYSTNWQFFGPPTFFGQSSFDRVNLTVTGVSAVPEPASMVYGSLVAGSMGLTYLRRRRAAKLA